MESKEFNLYYCRTPINIVYALSILHKNNNNILVINKNIACVNIIFIKKILKLLSISFDKIFFVDFNNDHIKGNFIERVIIRHNNIKKVQKNPIFKKIQNLKIRKYFGCGDEFDNAFYNLFNKKYNIEYNFLEHGYGNLINTIIFKPNIKRSFYYLSLKFFYSIKLLNIFPIKYNYFCGILGRNLKGKEDLYIHNKKVKYKSLNNVSKIIKLLNNKIQFDKKIPKNNVMVNFSTLEFSKDKKEIDLLIDKTIQKINPKDYCYYTSHPRNLDREKTINYIKKKFGNSGLRLNRLNEKFFNYAPAEFIVFGLSTKIILSNLSSIPLNVSILNRSVKNYIFLDYSLDNPNKNHGPAHNKSCKKYYIKYFKKVYFI